MVAVILPQTVFLPFAAFFVCLCLGLGVFCPGVRLGGAVLLAGAAVGLAFFHHSRNQLEENQLLYGSRWVSISGWVERVDAGYSPGRVEAQLRVDQVEGQAVEFRCLCPDLPACEVGDRIEAVFWLETPAQEDCLSCYADGLTFAAEYGSGFVIAGREETFASRAYGWQQTLSQSVRRLLDSDTGGVLAAMVVGDRSWISPELTEAYRGAGLSHVLVVSGMHATILCGGFLGAGRRERRKLWHSRLRAAAGAGMALLLVGITGFTPSVIRAGVSLWISALGVWVLAPADALTSLAVAGVCIALPNGYAVWDLGFELSFAAVLGTLAGVELARRGRERWQAARAKKKRSRRSPSRGGRLGLRAAGALWDSLCIAVCASAATFPILVVRGVSASFYGLVSSVAVLWMVQPILLLGIGAALTGLLPLLGPLYQAFSFGAGLLVWLLNGWARMVADWPGARLYFETGYAAALCLVVTGLCLLAARWKVRLRFALPVVLLTVSLGILAGNALERSVIRVSLVGAANTPSVVIAQNGQAVVLYRGGANGQAAVEERLARDGVESVALLVDLRLSEESPCTLGAEEVVLAAEMEKYQTAKYRCGSVSVELLRTAEGCGVRILAAGQSLVTVNGTFELARPVSADWLLVSPSDPEAFHWQSGLALRAGYGWMTGEEELCLGQTLSLRPGGGWRLS